MRARRGTLPVRAPRDRSRSPSRARRRRRVTQSSASGVAATRAAPEARDRTFADRLLALAPLLSLFVWLCAVYGWEAWRHGAPWLFGDELGLSQLSRAIGSTGHAARRGLECAYDSTFSYAF